MNANENKASVEATEEQSPYSLFATNKSAEKEGITLNYGSFYLVIGRAGGGNTQFTKRQEALFKPYRRQIQTDTLDEKVAEKVAIQLYVETVVKGGGSTKFGEGAVPDLNGNKLVLDHAGVTQLFTDLPDLFADVREQSQKVALFRDQVKEADAKN